MQLLIKCLDRGTITLSANPLDTIQDLLTQYSTKVGYPLTHSRLVYETTDLRTYHLLIEINYQKDTIIWEQPILKGGALSHLKFNSLENRIELRFGDSFENWLETIPGLNLWGKCTNPDCEAYTLDIILKLGFGQFSISKVIHE